MSDSVLYTRNGRFYELSKVKELQPNDYYLGSRTPTALKSTSVTIIFFYLPSDKTSQELRDIIAVLAASVAGIDYVAVNGAEEKEILKAYVETGNDVDHPLFPFAVTGFPTIMVYRKGWPQAYYNGDRTYDALLAYSLELAAKPGYYEPVNDYEGVAPSDPTLYAYERRLPGSTKSDYTDQEDDKEPEYTPYTEDGVLIPAELVTTDEV